jgi:hypothetical protein
MDPIPKIPQSCAGKYSKIKKKISETLVVSSILEEKYSICILMNIHNVPMKNST